MIKVADTQTMTQESFGISQENGITGWQLFDKEKENANFGHM
jgi:hypothetical protein